MNGKNDWPLVVVKVGGSLFEDSDLGSRLSTFLAQVHRGNWATALLVPGGGAAADVVRHWDRTFRLGDEAAHWLALRAAGLNARLLRMLVPGSLLVRHPTDVAAGGIGVLEALAFAEADENRAGHLPHTWAATTDSVAARAALVGAASELVLLKSTDLADSMDWSAAARAGFVDPLFPEVVAQLSRCSVRWVNLRRQSVAPTPGADPQGFG